MSDVTRPPSDVLAALRELHRPFGIYDECDCLWRTDANKHRRPDHVVDCGEFDTCLDPMWFVCAHCCRDLDDSYQLERCHDSHDHGPGRPICQTTAIIDQQVPKPPPRISGQLDLF
jgi:hypothetical protein